MTTEECKHNKCQVCGRCVREAYDHYAGMGDYFCLYPEPEMLEILDRMSATVHPIKKNKTS